MTLTNFLVNLTLREMNLKFSLKNLPIILSTLVLLLTIPLLIWGIYQKQEIRKQAAEPAESTGFPQVDLNGDGVINNVDLKIYLERFSPSPTPAK